MTWERIHWAAALRPARDGDESGDAYFVDRARDCLHVGVADGLGHGPRAAAVARAAIALLRGWAFESPLAIALRCHAALRATRGVALTLASLDEASGTLAWLGIGSVFATLLRGDGPRREERLLLHAGVVGRFLPPLHLARLTVRPGDTLVLATDGIDPEFARAQVALAPPWAGARAILAGYRTGRDDALVVVVRYGGGGA